MRGRLIMKLKVLLVDDNQQALSTLKQQLHSFSYIDIIGELYNGNDAIHFLRQSNEVDLIMLDIEMEDINGLDIALHIKERYAEVLVIFTTGHAGFALDGYEADPVDFLTKPIDPIRLETALQKAKKIKFPNEVKQVTNERIGLRVTKGIQIIEVQNILFIEKKGRAIYIHTKTNEKIKSSDTMQNLEAIFKPFDFYRPHQSFIIPIDQIRAIFPDKYARSYSIELANSNINIPLSRNRFSDLKRVLENKMIQIH